MLFAPSPMEQYREGIACFRGGLVAEGVAQALDNELLSADDTVDMENQVRRPEDKYLTNPNLFRTPKCQGHLSESSSRFVQADDGRREVPEASDEERNEKSVSDLYTIKRLPPLDA